MSTQIASNKPGAPGAGTANQNQTNSTTTCTVGCKLPFGFLAELGDKEDDTYRAYKLNGVNSAKIIGGFGITEGVPAAFFDAWAEKMKRFKMFKNGLIFKVEGKDEASVNAITKELKNQKSGLERLNPKALPKSLSDVQKHVTKADFAD